MQFLIITALLVVMFFLVFVVFLSQNGQLPLISTARVFRREPYSVRLGNFV